MNYDEWENSIPEEITEDSLWKMEAYRLGMFAVGLGWHDVTRLMHDRRTAGLSDQLYPSLGSMSTNMKKGYSRDTGKDRARFYEYALSSARESRDWYYKGRHVLGDNVARHRIGLLTQIIHLLLSMIRQQRTYKVSELQLNYRASLNPLLADIPLP